MSIWPLEAAPQYDAISYTWGDPALTAPVTINGHQLSVRQNCEYVMQQWFTTKTTGSKYIWVDAICIDQSNIKERGEQVTIMGELYKRSSYVLACVGPHADDSEYLFSFCRKEKILLSQLHSKEQPISFSTEQDRVWSEQWSRRINDIFRPAAAETTPVNGLFIGPRTKMRLRSACVAFMKRAYFSRVWILQELYMGTNVSYVCGADVIASELMLAVTLLADPAFEKELDKEYPWMTAGIKKISGFTSGLFAEPKNQTLAGTTYDSVQPYLACLGLAAESRDPFQLEGVLRFIHQFECMDKRDRLYGTLALVQWRNPYGRKQAIARPTPDYEKNSFRLAAEVFCILTPGGNGDIGCALSWVHHLFEVFDLNPSDPTIREAIKKRYTPRTELNSGAEGIGEDLRDHTEDELWWSMRICDPTSPEAQKPYNLHCSESIAGQKFVMLCDNNGQAFAQAPLQTSVGDFYIEMSRRTVTPTAWSALGIIVKGEPKLYHKQRNYSLLGLARRLPSQISVADRTWHSGESEKFKSIVLFWDVDDIFLLYLSTMMQAHLSIEYLVCIRICDPEREDSSFARLHWSANISE
ncbi:heterokaryon incompatibility protein-domain-containing protein [Phaeosphaeria sp. MPI-PUGE-AT-0046c]|nr:heterokaryon incompatibility protein-domain-containing protein [Phaeosphaeria sp. MPI-PUGE-AT-0046c]